MPVSADTVAALLEAGVTPEKLVNIIRLIDRDMAPKQDSAAERRRAYDRERKRKSGNSGGIPPEPHNDHSTGISTGIPPERPPLTRVLDITPTTEIDNPSEAKASSGSAGKIAKASRSVVPKSRRVPDGWMPTPRDWEIAETEGFVPGEIERELAKFRDHQFRDPHCDWSAAFRNWMRRAGESLPRPRLANGRPDHNPRRSPALDKLLDIDAAMVAAVQQSAGGYRGG